MGFSGEQLAMLGLLMEKKQMYYRLAYSMLGNEADALDAISQMTAQVVEKIHSLRASEAFLAWSRRILINVCHEFWRKNPKLLPMEEALAKESPSGLPIEDRLILRQLVGQLPEIHREVVYMRFYLDYEYKDIARILEIPDGTVKSRLNRALETLRQQMEGASYG
jgi:RNA polymerase sigma-70 factor (ECF subfamily)